MSISDNKNDVTGTSQLEIKKFLEQVGSLNTTTKCCATGTCDSSVTALEHSIEAKATVASDKKSPAGLRRTFGPIK